MRGLPYRIGTVDCKIEEDFIYNEEFELLRCGTPEYFINGEVKFPPCEEKDGTYRTKFGGASHSGVIYANTNENFKLAMRRLTGKRLPKEKGAHEALLASQTKWFADNQELVKKLRSMYEDTFNEYQGSEREAELHHADPHQKRRLRIDAFKELKESTALVDYRDLWVKSVWWKMKKNEYAKPGKKPRGICDLGVAASLRGAWTTNVLKVAQDQNDLEAFGGTFSFCKSPDPFELERHFNNLINPPGKFYFVYFSDDSCFSHRQKDGSVRLYNLDISSCDASHGPAVFDALVNIVPEGTPRDDMLRLVEQCKLPLRVISTGDKKKVVFLKPKVPKLMSGSTITTAINNLANLAIGFEIARSYEEAPDGVENPSMVAAAARVGYILTGCTPLKNEQGLQFLKHSPVLDTEGKWRPMLNLGVLIRASMTCDGDLPGRGPLIDRARAFQRGLLLGAYPYANFEILRNMKRAMGEGAVRWSDWTQKVGEAVGYPVYEVQREQICARYDLDDCEYSELIEFSKMDVFTFHNASGLSKVLNLDYGLTTIEEGVAPEPKR